VEVPLHCAEWPRNDLLLRCSSIYSEEKIPIGAVVAISDVTDQKRLDAAKGEMVALVSHELRTPLTSIYGFAQQLLRYSMDPERVRHVAETILRESNRLDQMTRAYLDLTRLEQQTLEPHVKPVDLADIAHAAAELMKAPAENKNITIRLNCQESPVIVQGQPELLERAVSNLLSNSIKYSAAATEIAIRVFAVDGTGCLAVKDSGIGIPPEALPHIFEKFYRVKSAASSQVPGSGLGLAYVREVAVQHGGTVSADSIAHQGSVFELRIPCWRRQ
jgi:two-component system phosphate regulon sensor histidine kinase PhoR